LAATTSRQDYDLPQINHAKSVAGVTVLCDNKNGGASNVYLQGHLETRVATKLDLDISKHGR